MVTNYIYALLDPDTDEVRYIGRTIHLKSRMYGHCHVTLKPRTQRDLWVNSLAAQGKKPKMIVLEQGCPVSAEEKWIQHYRKQGAALTNGVMLGGGRYSQSSISVSKEHKEKIRVLMEEHVARTGKIIPESEIVGMIIDLFIETQQKDSQS